MSFDKYIHTCTPHPNQNTDIHCSRKFPHASSQLMSPAPFPSTDSSAFYLLCHLYPIIFSNSQLIWEQCPSPWDGSASFFQGFVAEHIGNELHIYGNFSF